MESEGRTRSGANRGSRRSQRSDWRVNSTPSGKTSSQYSSSDEESDLKTGGRGFRTPLKAGDRGGSGRARVTPSDLVPPQSNISESSYHYEKSPSRLHPAASDPVSDDCPSEDLCPPLPSMHSQQGGQQPPHYYQEVPQGHYANHLDEYDSPVIKGARRPHVVRRMGPTQGSSISSSDNNSDTTYAESDINNSLRARMAALDNEIAGTPPDPAPPEVPPRGPSHHHPLLAAQRRGGGPLPPGNPGSPHYQDQPQEDGYQQPTPNVFLSQEYLMSGTSPRYGGSGGGKSPGGPTLYGPSPTREYLPSDFSQPSRIIGTLGSQKEAAFCTPVGGAGGVGLTALPVVRNNLNLSSRASFSGRGLHLGKTWRERCSWRCVAIALICLSAVLAALLTYFVIVYANAEGRSKGCLVAEDPAKVIAAELDTTTFYPTPAYTIPFTTPRVKGVSLNDPGIGTELTRLKVPNRRHTNNIPPQGYWNVQFVVNQPGFKRFNLTVPRNSHLAIFGRRNVAPSITQYDFVEFIRGGRLGRSKRETTKDFRSRLLRDSLPLDPNSDKGQNDSDPWIEYNDDDLFNDGDFDEASYNYYYDEDDYSDDEDDEDNTRWRNGDTNEEVSPNGDASGGDGLKSRSKRYLSDREANVSIIEHLDAGIWYLSIYNDGLGFIQVSILVEEAPELQSACLNDCTEHGSCVLGRCKCIQGWVGEDCSKSVCPVLCSGHGAYGGGLCHCTSGWKGIECDVPFSDCERPDCNGHGNCIGGSCRCNAGWKGDHCHVVDCDDPLCGSHGWCVEGSCVCRAGWTGTNCTQRDHKVFACLPDCSRHGHYDLHSSACICDAFWTGHQCSEERCSLDCIRGTCDGDVCLCEAGWTGIRCNERDCDPRCNLHGQCHNGTCLCVQGWNGRHCTIPGCVNGCSGHGLCTTEDGIYRCSCTVGWMGADCSVALETQCNDEKDNDRDGLADCNDSECCATPECRDHVMCMVSSDPVEVLLRKQPPAVTASFYQRVKFIIEDKNVQSFARKDEFSERRVSVIRGRVVTTQGQGIVGVRTSVEKESKYGLTATRRGGWFDVLVNGGGAVTLQFQRAHFEPLTVTVPVLWNQIIVLDPIIMRLKDQVQEQPDKSPEERWSDPCNEHNYEMMRPQVVPTYLRHAVGGAADASVVFTEHQVIQESLRIPGSDLHLVYHSSSVAGYLSTLLLQLTPDRVPSSLSMVHLKVTLEGTVFERIFEADPNITYTFSWNKRNVYKQKVYGETSAIVSVGYEYSSCSQLVWETLTARLHGFHMDISDVGGWNLNIHHMYNFESGLLQRGDGSTLNFKDTPRLVKPLMGTGSQRPLSCRQCSGLARDAKLLTPSALVAGPDGSVYVGDFNLIRRVSPDGMVSTILQLSATKVSYGYHLALSPADGKLYMSDPEKYTVIRLLSLENVTDPLNNLEVFAGNGERCIPGDERHCGDKGPAHKARLSHPKGLAMSADRTMYIADGTNIRMVDPRGIIHTLIGHHGHKAKWMPLPCTGGIPSSQVQLQWPTSLALSTLDDSLHILDDHVALQVTTDGSVRVRAGTPLHCQTSDQSPAVGTISGMAFSPFGSLILAVETASNRFSVKELSPAGVLSHFAGSSPEDCGCETPDECICPQDKVLLSTSLLLGPISGIAVSADGVVHIADQQKLKIFSFIPYLPEDDPNGEYQVAYPMTNELYLFNRHGHHVETRDLVTGRTLHAFLYSKNTSFGRLSKVTDSSGNKIMFLRDYKSAVSQVENTAGQKFKVEISRLGLMTKFSESDYRHHHYTYDDNTGLLLAATTPGRLTTIYEYDSDGRLQTVVSPTGHRLGLHSWMGGRGARKHLTVGIGVNSIEPDQGEDFGAAHVLSLVGDNKAVFKHGDTVCEMEVWSNGTWHQTFPWGGRASALYPYSNPLLEASHPTQARLLPVPQRFSLTSSGDDHLNTLVTSYGVIDDRHRDQRLVEKVILVNGSRILSRRWKGIDRAEVLTDGERRPLLHLAYNSNAQPTHFVLGDRLSSLNITYDRFGRLSSRHWEKSGEEYDYDSKGLLSAITTSTSAVTRYSFNDDKLLESLTLPSGRTWTYRYDQQGGLKMISTPSGSSHIFSLQPSFGAYLFSYTPPGTAHPYRQHLDQSGRLVLTVFPQGSSKILNVYSDSGQIKEIVSGDGKSQFVYGNDGQVAEIYHEDGELDYKVDLLYKGRLLVEYRIDYGSRTGLSNAKFIYAYDSNFRLTGLSGRIGGQNLKIFYHEYEQSSGAPSRIGPFVVSSSGNETTLDDGTAIFSRQIDSHFRVIMLSVTIHKMEVFRLDLKYKRNGKISQSNTYTRNFHTKSYTKTKNYTYDADGQLTAVKEAKEPWSFSYDANGNMLSLTYSTNTIPMKYDAQDRIINFGEGSYKYDPKGDIVQNVREVNYQFNSRGLLVQASKAGRLNIRFFYDHESRLIARKDNFGNVTEYIYADPRFSDQISHIYNPRDGNLITLVYDDRGHIIFTRVNRNEYYVATDDCGTPMMVFNRYGEVVREIIRSPYGHIIYDSNPYFYLAIDYCGGLLESRTELVHMPGGKVYDPLIGLWLSPNWDNVLENLMTPSHLSLYRFNGNDPINTKRRSQWKNYNHASWLKVLGYDISSIAPQLSQDVSRNNYRMGRSEHRDLWHAFTQVPMQSSLVTESPFKNQVRGVECVSGFVQTHKESLEFASRLATIVPSALRRDFWPDTHQFELSTVPGPFGEGVLVSTIDGRAVVTATPQANPIFRDVLTSVFNSSLLLDVVLNSHNSYVFYFVKENYWKASEDMTQLNRLGGEVNISVHEPGLSTSQSPDEDKVADVKLHTSSAIIHIRYGASPQQERKRLLKHAKKVAIRRAWTEERDRVSLGLLGTVQWTNNELEELMSRTTVSSYTAHYLHAPEDYPLLLDDPTNIKFYKDAKRTRRNSKARKSHRCRKKWWRIFC